MIKTLRVFWIVFFIGLTCTLSYSSSNKRIDDWQYNATSEEGYGRGKAPLMGVTPMSFKAMGSSSVAKMGLTVGGARDANNFYENLKQGYLPKIHSITHEGVFAEHYFETGENTQCQDLFCPNFFTAVSRNPYTQIPEYYLSAGLSSGMTQQEFKRKKLNLVIVLDISGSMSAPFNAYYYDRGKKVTLPEEDRKKSKMQIANESIVAMFSHLTDDDRLGIVLFDDRAYLAKPLRLIKYTDMDAIKRHVLALRPRGGTNWSAGYKKGLSLFKALDASEKDRTQYENRIIFLTDAMPNTGELGEDRLFGLFKRASEQGIYTSFVGIGVDFNNDLVHLVSRTKGANYFSVHSSKAFKERMDKEFDYWVTPLVFDLKMELVGDGLSIDAIYGAPEADKQKGTILYLGTLFPSDTKDEKVKGGIILVKLKDAPKNREGLLRLSYSDRAGKMHKVERTVRFSDCCYYENNAIKKGILLARYVNLMQNWLIDTRKACNDKVSGYAIYPEPPHILKEKALIPPRNRPEWIKVETWERKSCPLVVSPGYKDLFSVFYRYLKKEAGPLSKDLKKEMDTVKRLSDFKANPANKEKTDDWQLNGQDRPIR